MHWPTVILGAVGLALLFALPHVSRLLPGPLLVLVPGLACGPVGRADGAYPVMTGSVLDEGDVLVVGTPGAGREDLLGDDLIGHFLHAVDLADFGKHPGTVGSLR